MYNIDVTFNAESVCVYLFAAQRRNTVTKIVKIVWKTKGDEYDFIKETLRRKREIPCQNQSYVIKPFSEHFWGTILYHKLYFYIKKNLFSK